MVVIPEVLEQVILDYACIKRSNSEYSDNFIINIHLNGIYEKRIIREWFLESIKTIAEDSNNNISVIFNFEGQTLTICIRNTDMNWCPTKNIVSDEHAIILYEKAQNININADDILHVLSHELMQINKIGVSGVSSRCMKYYWLKSVNYHDKHEMWYYNDKWLYINKRGSYSFDW
tara:strand:+ start:114 stop:638 length:525 start_codon:yes stop_codon:yes gene_type:complete